MASDPQFPDPPAGGSRQRPGPTIDLSAKEVASEPVAAAPSEPSKAEAKPEAEPPKAEQPPPASAARPAKPQRARASFGGLLMAGILGAVLALVLFLAAGRFTGGGSDTADVLASRLAGLELEVRELAGRPAPAGVDPKAVEDLAARLGRLEAAAQRAPATDPALANRLTALDNAIKALDERVGVAARHGDTNAAALADLTRTVGELSRTVADLSREAAQPAAPTISRSEVEALSARLAAAEKALGTLTAELAKRPETADRAARLAVMAAALATVLDRGEAYASELAALRALGADPKALAPLEPFAATGLPSTTALARELTALLPALREAAARAGGGSDGGGFLDRLQANAEKLVRVRPTGSAAGADLAAILARVEQRAAQADLAGALSELARLPEPVRAPAQAFIAKAQARDSAIAASWRLADDALTALGKA